ncbi:MAG: deoxyuridine 5'-triphosphate nucleotidohydrolase [Bacilli bacterium]|nr:deoxyuridine 5'-triphosphate nucleotidohydrolase [Bacilli bacterium]MDD4795658.1 deoxyuridine 5'-triphosphate nucleotidohydrolase [Bacilli bacterium]
MRKFEKISLKQFKKDIGNNQDLYNNYKLPIRKTKSSGGYDLFSLLDYELKPKDSIIIPTGVKCSMQADEILMIVIRSSLGFKHGIKLANQVGIIDADYYNNEDNDGHIFIKIENTSDKMFSIKVGDAIAQGLFIKYGVVANEEEIKEERKGGIGSTGK